MQKGGELTANHFSCTSDNALWLVLRVCVAELYHMEMEGMTIDSSVAL